MTEEEAVFARRSVRSYFERPIEEEKAARLAEEAERCNAEGGLSIRLVRDEPDAFRSFLARYGKFSGVSDYFAIVGKKGKGLYERAGYYGERLVLLAETLGLNTCWAALSFSKGAARRAAKPEKGEKLVCVIAVGYGKTQGAPRRSKAAADVMRAQDPPDWFLRGVEFALRAPTAVNQQKFRFTLTGEREVFAERLGGFYGEIDLGIVKYHFELGAGKENFVWREQTGGKKAR